MDIFLHLACFTQQYVVEICLCCSLQWLRYILVDITDNTASPVWILVAISPLLETMPTELSCTCLLVQMCVSLEQIFRSGFSGSQNIHIQNFLQILSKWYTILPQTSNL